MCPCSRSSREQWPLWKGERILHKDWNMPDWQGLQNTHKAASPPLSEQLTSGQRQPGSLSRWSGRCRRRSSSQAGSSRSPCCHWKQCGCRSGRWGACTGERKKAVRVDPCPMMRRKILGKAIEDGSENRPQGETWMSAIESSIHFLGSLGGLISFIKSSLACSATIV